MTGSNSPPQFLPFLPKLRHLKSLTFSGRSSFVLSAPFSFRRFAAVERCALCDFLTISYFFPQISFFLSVPSEDALSRFSFFFGRGDFSGLF